MKLENFSRGMALLMLVVGVGFGIYAFCGALPPKPLPKNAPDTAFSAMRAHEHLYEFAHEQHEAGTAAHREARDYLVGVLNSYGLEVVVDHRIVSEVQWAMEIDTILARIPGTDNKTPLMVTAHYDSAINALGAADDGSGVVVMLEMARMLMARGTQYKNDIVFVFTSDEELGGRSATTSVDHPWLENMLGIIGLEGRGYYGPAYMFETSPGNQFLIQELLKVGAPSVANSLMYTVHDATPNGTDFGTLKRKGYKGYNVAFVGGLYYYHTLNDSPDNMSPATLQHMGGYLEAFLAHFGDWDQGAWPDDDPDSVFFNTVGHHLVMYPINWSHGIAAGTLVAFLIAFGLAWRRRAIRLGHVLLGLIGVILAAGLAAGVAFGLMYLSYQLLYVYVMYNAAYYYIAAFLIAGGIFLFVAATLFRWLRPAEIYTSVLILWAAALGGSHYIAPTTSFIAAWTVIFGTVGLALWALMRERRGEALLSPVFALLPVLPALAFGGPGLYALYLMGASLSIAASTAIWMVLLLVLAPFLLSVFTVRKGSIGLTLVLIGLLVWGVGITRNGFSPAKPQVVSLSYALNQATNEAAFFSTDREVNPWTATFLGDAPEAGALRDIFETRSGNARHKVMTRAVDLPGPVVELVGERVEDELRILNLRYTSQGKAKESLLTVLEPSNIRRVSLNGEPLLAGGPLWELKIRTMPRSGVLDLEFAVDEDADFRIAVHEVMIGLPESVLALGDGPMPAWMVPKSNTLDWWEGNRVGSNRLLIDNTFHFPAPEPAPEPAPAPESEPAPAPEPVPAPEAAPAPEPASEAAVEVPEVMTEESEERDGVVETLVENVPTVGTIEADEAPNTAETTPEGGTPSSADGDDGGEAPVTPAPEPSVPDESEEAPATVVEEAPSPAEAREVSAPVDEIADEVTED